MSGWLTVFRKEVMENLRDRRAAFNSLLLGPILFPFIIIGMTSRRAVPPASLVLIPWAAMAIPELTPSSARISRPVMAVLGVVVGAIVLLPMLTRPLGALSAERFPTPDLIEAMGTDRAFHGDAEGGYLIFAQWPQRLVYIDDRAELYDVDHFLEYRDIRNGIYEDAFERWDIDVALSRTDWTLTEVLTADGWQIRAENDEFVVFGRP